MTDIEKKTGMTDAECEYWDKHIIENTQVINDLVHEKLAVGV
jgi:hypothetical protein